jgi:hypothetical protein
MLKILDSHSLEKDCESSNVRIHVKASSLDGQGIR